MKPSELIADEKRWTTSKMARDSSDNEVMLGSYRAAKWCAAGAICHCYTRGIDVNGIWAEADKKALEMYGVLLAPLNDGPDGHARVLEVLRAIGQ